MIVYVQVKSLSRLHRRGCMTGVPILSYVNIAGGTTVLAEQRTKAGRDGGGELLVELKEVLLG